MWGLLSNFILSFLLLQSTTDIQGVAQKNWRTFLWSVSKVLISIICHVGFVACLLIVVWSRDQVTHKDLAEDQRYHRYYLVASSLAGLLYVVMLVEAAACDTYHYIRTFSQTTSVQEYIQVRVCIHLTRQDRLSGHGFGQMELFVHALTSMQFIYTALDVRAWMSNYIPLNVITYPSPNPDTDLISLCELKEDAEARNRQPIVCHPGRATSSKCDLCYKLGSSLYCCISYNFLWYWTVLERDSTVLSKCECLNIYYFNVILPVYYQR